MTMPFFFTSPEELVCKVQQCIEELGKEII